MYLDLDIHARLEERAIARALSRAAVLAADDVEPLKAMTSPHWVGHLGESRVDTRIECPHGRTPAAPVSVHTRSPLLNVPARLLDLEVRALWVPLHTRLEGIASVNFADGDHVVLSGTMRGYSSGGQNSARACAECFAEMIEQALAQVLHTYAARIGARRLASVREPAAAAISGVLARLEGGER